MLELDRETVVAGAIVGAEQRDVWRVVRQGKAGDELVAAILMDALLVLVGEAEAPSFGEVLFERGASLQRVRRAVVRIDERALAAVGAARKTCRIAEVVGDAR